MFLELESSLFILGHDNVSGSHSSDKRIDTKLNDNRHGDELVIDEIGSKRRIFLSGLFFIQLQQINRVSFRVYFIIRKSDNKNFISIIKKFEMIFVIELI